MARPKTLKSICEVADCKLSVRAKNLCCAHYDRLRKTGTVSADIPVGDLSYRGKQVSSAKKGNCPYRSGSLNPNWKGGITDESHKLRRKFQYSLRKEVLARDNNTCVICDTQSENLHVDHIKSWTDFPELRFEITNCRTLCVPCHYYVTFRRRLAIGKSWCGYVRMA